MYIFPEILANSQSMRKLKNNIKTLGTVTLVLITKAEDILAFSARTQGRDWDVNTELRAICKPRLARFVINRSHSFNCRDCFEFGDNRSRLRNWYNVWSLCWTACGFFDVRHNWEQLSVQVNYFFEVYVAVALCRWRRFLISWGIRERSTGRYDVI